MNIIFIHFSDWIILWYILYHFKIIKYNPKLFILFGIIDNIIGLGILIYKSREYIGISISLIIKFLMYYSLRNSSYNINDFKGGVLIYLV